MLEESNSDGDYWNEFGLDDPLGDEFVVQIFQQSMLLEYFNSMQVRVTIPSYLFNQISANREILKKYTTLSTQPRPKPSPFDKQKDPFFIVKVLKSQGQLIDCQYYINKDGLIDSKKNTITEDIVIGKLSHQGNTLTIPNDIILNHDRNIGKVHCKLITKPTFQCHSQTPTQLYLFLSSNLAKRLPFAILTIIKHFVRYTPEIGIQDLGTGLGTQVKLSNKKGLLMQVNQSFLIGSETKFKILEMDICHIKDRSFFTSRFSNVQFIEKLKPQPNEAHYLLLAVHRLEPTFYLFISNIDNSVFKIGRSQDSEIKIDQNTISRKQCRVMYSQNKWMIFDGEIDKESSNGSWFEIKSDNDKDNESEIQTFYDDFEMKIGETILRVEFHNFHKPKQQLIDINNLLN